MISAIQIVPPSMSTNSPKFQSLTFIGRVNFEIIAEAQSYAVERSIPTYIYDFEQYRWYSQTEYRVIMDVPDA